MSKRSPNLKVDFQQLASEIVEKSDKAVDLLLALSCGFYGYKAGGQAGALTSVLAYRMATKAGSEVAAASGVAILAGLGLAQPEVIKGMGDAVYNAQKQFAEWTGQTMEEWRKNLVQHKLVLVRPFP